MSDTIIRVSRVAKATKRLAVIGGTTGWHLQQLVDASERASASLQGFEYTALHANGGGVCLGDGPIDRFDAILTRTMPAGSLELVTLRLSMLHEAAASVPVVNHPAALELAIDKYRTIAIATRLGIPTPPTSIAQDRSTAMEQFVCLGSDTVVKPIFGGEGRGVMRVNDIELARTVFTTLQTAGLIIHQQQFIPPGGRDRRQLIAGDFVQSVSRMNNDDFRTNRAAGSQVSAIDDDDCLLDQSRKLLDQLGLHVAAVDWIDGPDGPLLLEVNGIPGWKATQGVTKICIADQVIASVLKAI